MFRFQFEVLLLKFFYVMNEIDLDSFQQKNIFLIDKLDKWFDY